MDALQPGLTGRRAFSVDEFCAAHGISRAMFYKLGKERKAPRLMKVGTRTLISEEAAADWRRQMEVSAT
jgi:predicted DNA-binding transcriptional regulator AlpA